MSNPFTEYKKIVRENVPLAMHTWLQLGGPAAFFAEPQNTDELVALLKIARTNQLPIRILGFGSNILVADEGVSGLVLRLTAPAFCQIGSKNNRIHAGGGAKLGRVITQSVHDGLAGLEMLIGIPGTVGGAIRGNTGSNNDTIGPLVEQIEVLDDSGEISTLTPDDFSFGYRECRIKEGIILSAVLQLRLEDPYELAKRMQKLWIVRKTSEPIGQQCAGHVFRDPRRVQAGELIELAGLKGTRIGGAVISEHNANFIQAEPNCSSNDVLRLIDLVRTQVRERQDVELELGIEIW